MLLVNLLVANRNCFSLVDLLRRLYCMRVTVILANMMMMIMMMIYLFVIWSVAVQCLKVIVLSTMKSDGLEWLAELYLDYIVVPLSCQHHLGDTRWNISQSASPSSRRLASVFVVHYNNISSSDHCRYWRPPRRRWRGHLPINILVGGRQYPPIVLRTFGNTSRARPMTAFNDGFCSLVCSKIQNLPQNQPEPHWGTSW